MKIVYLIIVAVVSIIMIIASIFGFNYLFEPSTSPEISSSPNVSDPAESISALLNGAGATFPQPLISAIVAEYTQSIAMSVKINYQAIGSGGGISALQGKTVDFAASDAPLSTTQITNMPNILHIPATIGAVTVAYNLPNVTAGLHLTGQVIADIFEGKITLWNDAAIQSLNPDLTLPKKSILVVHRSDGSGTTFVFTGYLKAVSATWASEIGQGKSVGWPVGTGSSGNAGVASVIEGQPYAIGYVELAYAIDNNMSIAAIQNLAGNWILPSLNSIQMAAQSVASEGLPAGDASWASVNLLNSPHEKAYPIVSFSYLLSYKELNIIPGMKQDQAIALVEFLWYLIHDGQNLSSSLEYAPLPTNVVQTNEASLRVITFNGVKIIS